MTKWVNDGIPTVFELPSFYFPQAFLTGMLQNYSRATKVAINELFIEFEVVKPDWKPPEDAMAEGGYVSGLFLEAAVWDPRRNSLAEAMPRQLFVDMPVLYFKPARKGMDSVYPPGKHLYNCPVYRTATRAGTLSTTGHSTNYILTIQLLSDIDPAHWIRRGVALMSETDK